jgi:hypothetical protein
MKRALYSLSVVLVLALEIVVFTQQAKAACAIANCGGGVSVQCCGYICTSGPSSCQCVGPNGEPQVSGACAGS